MYVQEIKSSEYISHFFIIYIDNFYVSCAKALQTFLHLHKTPAGHLFQFSTNNPTETRYSVTSQKFVHGIIPRFKVFMKHLLVS